MDKDDGRPESKLKEHGHYAGGSAGIGDTGFSLKQVRDYFGLPTPRRLKANCVECARKYDAWYEGSRRLERYCPNCRKQI